tara:strand:- start:96 stop:443 length:348 start_codon:yes stop_codon:yes gene_type:complete
MKYFAKLNEADIVIGITHIHEDNAPNEQAGINFLNNAHNHSSWKEYSKNGSIRKNGAIKGHVYDEGRDAFIAPQPYPSWTLNESTCCWEPPVAYPQNIDEQAYTWNEGTTSWDEV